MDILAPLPDTPAGRHTKWLWSWVLDAGRGSLPPEPEELAKHFAPSVFQQVSAESLAAHLAALAPLMRSVTQLLEETDSRQHYSALLGLPNSWLRYACLTEDDEPHLLIEASFSQAIDPSRYSDRRVQRDGRDVQIRDFGGTGPLMLLWHGAGGDLANWEILVPHLTGLHVVAQDLPGHGRSTLRGFTASDALADADAVIDELAEGPPTIVGHSLGGYLALRYAATRDCSGWIGLDGPFGLVYPWGLDDQSLSETALQIGREIRGIDVASDLAAAKCAGMLLLCAGPANPVEEPMVPARRKLAEHIVRQHPGIRIEWVHTGHDAIVFNHPESTAARIRDFLNGTKQRPASSL